MLPQNWSAYYLCALDRRHDRTCYLRHPIAQCHSLEGRIYQYGGEVMQVCTLSLGRVFNISKLSP